MTSSHDLAKSDSLSTLSKDSTETSATPSTEAFSPVKALNIHSRGIRLIRLPVPSNELTIPVYDTTGRVCYVSRRNKTCSGDAVLFGIGGGNHDDRRHSEQWEDDGRTFEGAPLIETEYFFGPGRDPVITILDQDEPAASKKSTVESQKSLDEKHQLAPSLRSVTTNSTLVGAPSASNHKSSFKFTSAWSFKTCSFIVPGSNYKFTWEKERAILPSGEKAKLLSLYWHPTAGDSKSSPKVKVAHLVRSASTRTPGTRPSTAGNGGRLELSHLIQCTGDQTMLASNIVYDLEKKTASSQEPVIDEALVVATCLSMMKKEGDRRRALQFMMIGAMASGGA